MKAPLRGLRAGGGYASNRLPCSPNRDHVRSGPIWLQKFRKEILFLPLIQGLNERNLRPIASRIDRDEQRRMFQKITDRVDSPARNASRPPHLPDPS